MNNLKSILLVEDDQFKAKAVLSLMANDFPDVTVEQAKSLSAGYRKLEAHQFDLLLLDMSLPTFDVGPHDSGGEPLGFGGFKLLDLLTESGLALPTIVVTQFEQFGEGEHAISVHSLNDSLRKTFPDHFIDLVRYNSASTDWRIDLSKLILQLKTKDTK